MERFTITRLGHLGDGVATSDAGETFAPFTLPGETIAAARSGDHLDAVTIERESPDRIDPVCPHFGVCGGCALQHAGDAFIASWKVGMIAAALASRGLSAPMRPIDTSPPGARRRVSLAGRRTKKTVLLGYHGRADGGIVPIRDCAVAHPGIVAALPVLAGMVGLTASRAGEARVAVTVSETGLDVELHGARPLDGPLRQRLAAIAESADLARLGYSGEPIAMRRAPTHRFGRARVTPPPGAFLQATREGEAALLAAIREAVSGVGRIVDLFAGCGTFSLPLAEDAAILAIEADAGALAALDAGWRAAPGLRAVRTEARDLFRRPLRPEDLKPFDAVVLDPPRAGALAQAQELARSAVPRVAMASCNPATFARDARVLVDGGYALSWVKPVDQFRWSPHVELVGAFARL